MKVKKVKMLGGRGKNEKEVNITWMLCALWKKQKEQTPCRIKWNKIDEETQYKRRVRTEKIYFITNQEK